MRERKVIESEILEILAMPSEREMSTRLLAYTSALPDDEFYFAAEFLSKRRAVMEKAASRAARN